MIMRIRRNRQEPVGGLDNEGVRTRTMGYKRGFLEHAFPGRSPTVHAVLIQQAEHGFQPEALQQTGLVEQ